jgi:cytosol alanyl aminopeptidase
MSSCMKYPIFAAVLLLAATAAAVAKTVPTGPLPRDVELLGTTLELRIDPSASGLSGRVDLAVNLKQRTDTFWLHGRELKIERASITPEGGKPMPLQVRLADVSGVLELTAATPIPPGKAHVEIIYSAPYGQLQGAYKVSSEGNDYVLTHMEPLGARNTFPGFDEPSFKQPWQISLIVRQEHVAVANARLLKQEKLADGWKKLTYARTQNLPSYLIAFAVGPWDLLEAKDIPANAVRKTPLPLRGLAAKGRGPRMSYALEHTAQIVQALENYFGLPYPYDKLDLLAAPDFAIGAMENAGLIVYRDSLMFANDESPANVKQSYWVVHAHELSHQWFGNLVSIPWWDDTWLKEAFATWMGIKIAGQLQPAFHTDRTLLEDGLRAMGGDSYASTRRVREPIKDFTDVRSAFDGITYSKGGAVLQMFERFVGAERFRQAIRAYLQQHAGANATSADLVEAIAAHSENPAGVRAALNSFLDQPGVPFVLAQIDCADPAQPVLQVEQSRFLPLGSLASRGERWGLPLCVRYEAAGELHEQCALIEQAQARLKLQARACPKWVMPNAHGSGYYRYALAAKDRPTLAAAFDRLDANEQRSYADSLAAAFANGTINADDYLAVVPRLASAPGRLTATSAFGQIEWMIEHLAPDPAARARLREFVAAVYGPRLTALGLDPKAGETDEDRLLRARLAFFIADIAKTGPLRDEMAKRGRGMLGVSSEQGSAQPVAADMRGLALKMAVQDGGNATFDAAIKQLRAASDPVLRGELVAALGSVSDATSFRRARELALQPELLRRNEVYQLLGSLSENEQLQMMQRQWIDERFDALAARVMPTGANLVRYYAEGFCGAADADALQSKFAARTGSMEGGPRTLAQTVEAARLCGALRDAQRAVRLMPAIPAGDRNE